MYGLFILHSWGNKSDSKVLDLQHVIFKSLKLLILVDYYGIAY